MAEPNYDDLIDDDLAAELFDEAVQERLFQRGKKAMQRIGPMTLEEHALAAQKISFDDVLDDMLQLIMGSRDYPEAIETDMHQSFLEQKDWVSELDDNLVSFALTNRDAPEFDMTRAVYTKEDADFGRELFASGLFRFPYDHVNVRMRLSDAPEGTLLACIEQDAADQYDPFYNVLFCRVDNEGSAKPFFRVSADVEGLGVTVLCAKSTVREETLDRIAGGMFTYCVGLFTSLMTAGLEVREFNPDEKLQKARKKRGKPPLPVKYQVTTVKLKQHAKYVKSLSDLPTGTHASPRPHRRRGHLRHIKRKRDAYVPVIPCFVGGNGEGVSSVGRRMYDMVKTACREREKES